MRSPAWNVCGRSPRLPIPCAARQLARCFLRRSRRVFALPEVERVMGIEPTLSAWEAEVLPLNYTRMARHCYRFTGAGQCRGNAGSRHDRASWLNNRRDVLPGFLVAWRFSSTARPAKWPKATASRNWWKSWACAVSASRWRSTWKSCRAAATPSTCSAPATASRSSAPSAAGERSTAPLGLVPTRRYNLFSYDESGFLVMAQPQRDSLILAGREYQSRLLVGTGKYKDLDEARRAVEASGAEIITEAIRRPNIGQTLAAAEILIKDGFKVMVYTNDDPIVAKGFEAMGCVAVMPLAAPIGSGLGIRNPYNIRTIVENAEVPILVDAGVGTASDAAVAMELGCDGVLMNTAIAGAQQPVLMASAMKKAIEAGREAVLAGRIPRKRFASASSPIDGTFF